ncbi:trypsin-like peptidase domain-containing protein [Paraburkholderia atlantica]|uniref:trypsin-like peptidase domain-containing protein n=1 Tax=Paraburkholderia atlantica TaxID=2654982 RepID=UPI0016071B96|nr:trypsin-like peptidase domain-containing protein [Paraburkholderia atlantica]MBB5510357.1 S1-C subfamily serine protease [Paraburkholderia atlantica]
MFRRTLTRTLLHAAVVAGLLCGCPWLLPAAIAADIASPQPAEGKLVAPANAATPSDFPTIVERYGPAVVHIRATAPEKQTSAPAPEDIGPHDPIAAFFSGVAPQSPEPQRNIARVTTGTGSGFIISPDGLILTTAHVVDQADQVTVSLTDRREFKGKVLVVDTDSDVAVIQIDAAALPAVKLGDSSRVRVGEQVLTIGSPDRYQNTVTTGIVSATSRVLPDGSNFSFFQTEVAATPDNSGGPLFDRAGEVIGIDVQVYPDVGRYPSLTFAIPINLASKVRAQLQTQSNGPAGIPGVEVQDVGPGLAVAIGLPRPAGALVNVVTPGTPAAASGLKSGDVITQIGDRTIARSAELAQYAAGLQPGTKTTLTLIRSQKPMTTEIIIGAAGEIQSAVQTPGAASNPGPAQSASAAPDRLGLTMHPLNNDEKRASDLPGGMMVDQVTGPAAAAGIRTGDIVLSLNGELIESREQASALEAKAKNGISVLIQRQHARRFVSVTLR